MTQRTSVSKPTERARTANASVAWTEPERFTSHRHVLHGTRAVAARNTYNASSTVGSEPEVEHGRPHAAGVNGNVVVVTEPVEQSTSTSSGGGGSIGTRTGGGVPHPRAEAVFPHAPQAPVATGDELDRPRPAARRRRKAEPPHTLRAGVATGDEKDPRRPAARRWRKAPPPHTSRAAVATGDDVNP